MDRSEKKEFVSTLRSALKEAELVVVTQQTGLTVTEASDLRQRMRGAGASYKVVKNTLARIAVAETPYEGLRDLLKGPTGLAFSVDPISAAKISVEFAKDHSKFSVVGGAMGEKSLDQSAVNALAKLPSLDELRGKLVGLLSAPAGNIARVVQAPAAQVARVISAYGSSES